MRAPFQNAVTSGPAVVPRLRDAVPGGRRGSAPSAPWCPAAGATARACRCGRADG